MGTRVEVSLRCNRCSVERHGVAPATPTLPDLRQVLAQVGWFSDSARDLDLCPSCVTVTAHLEEDNIPPF